MSDSRIATASDGLSKPGSLWIRWVVLALGWVAATGWTGQSAESAVAIIQQTAPSPDTSAHVQEPRPQLGLAQKKRITETFRNHIGRSMSYSDASTRQQRLQRNLADVDQLLDKYPSDVEFATKLLPLKIRILTEQGQADAAAEIIDSLYHVYQVKYGDQTYNQWRAEQVEPYRDPTHIDLAVAHVRVAIGKLQELMAADAQLLVGDILMHHGAYSGIYEPAIEHFTTVAAVYDGQRQDIADTARFRMAKTLWWDGRVEEARAIFEELGRTGDPVVMELAEYYWDLSEIKYPPTQPSPGRDSANSKTPSEIVP